MKLSERERRVVRRLEWIARLAPRNCPGGVPADDRGWRDLVNRIVAEVRGAVEDLSGESDKISAEVVSRHRRAR